MAVVQLYTIYRSWLAEAEVASAPAHRASVVQCTPRAANDMNALTQLMLLSLCVCAHGAPLAELHQRRSDHGVYARDYGRDYEPVMYAAIPLHGPVPVMHVLSRRPLTRERAPAPSVQHPVYARPPYQDSEYASSAHNEYEYAGYGYGEPQGYADPYHYASSYVAPTGAASQDEVTILYARPNPHGGFSYRRRPAKTAPKRSPAPTTESPVIIRVHKYRIIRDR